MIRAFVCPANQHPKSTVKNKKSLSCSVHESRRTTRAKDGQKMEDGLFQIEHVGILNLAQTEYVNVLIACWGRIIKCILSHEYFDFDL